MSTNTEIEEAVAHVRGLLAGRDKAMPHPDYDLEQIGDEAAISYGDLRAILSLVLQEGGWKPPEGFVLVPVEPTREMRNAGGLADHFAIYGDDIRWEQISEDDQELHRRDAEKVYDAMLSVSPTPDQRSAGKED